MNPYVMLVYCLHLFRCAYDVSAFHFFGSRVFCLHFLGCIFADSGFG